MAIRVRPAVDTNVGISTGLAFSISTTGGAITAAWTLGHLAVTGAIVGARHVPQSEGVMRAGDLHLTEDEVNEIEAFAETAA